MTPYCSQVISAGNMNRLDTVLWQDRLHPMKTLPEICLELRMALNGSGDDWTPYPVDETLQMLEARSKTWTATNSVMDNCIFMLISATIMECNQLRANRCGAW